MTTETPDATRAAGADTASRRVRLPRATREQMMIDVATEVFGRLGYHDASMDQIADEAHISKPMLYAYFNSKEGLYEACMRRAGARLLEQVTNSYREGLSPERHLWDGFVAFFEFIREHRAAWLLICGRPFYGTERFREIAEGIHDDLRAVVAELCERSSRDTPGDPFADPQRRIAVAHAMLGAAEALGNWWCEQDQSLSPEVPCRLLMEFFWLGIDSLSEGKVWTESVLPS